jgi:DNA-binding CsgD family transcriptional regulator
MDATSRLRSPVVDEVVELCVRASSRPVLVRSVRGGGARQVVIAVAEELRTRGVGVEAVTSLGALAPDEQLRLRSTRHDKIVMMALEDVLPAATTSLVDYLRPRIVEVGSVGLDEVREVVERALGARCRTDELAMSVLTATAGRLGDVLDVVDHLATLTDRRVSSSLTGALAGFGPSEARLAGLGPSASVAPVALRRWAIATVEHVPVLAGRASGIGPGGPSDRTAPGGFDGVLHPVDAVVVCGAMDPAERADALQQLCADAAEVAGELTPDEKVTVASWWCELAAASGVGAPVGGPELQALVAGVFVAADVGRWDAVGRLAERLWRTTRVPQAAIGVAAALARSAPTPLLDELLDAHPDDESLRATAAFSRALWQLYVEHQPDRARATLEEALSSSSTHHELCEDGLATVDLHTGDPDAVERRVGDRPARPGQPASFALSALALADLQRGRHRKVLDRMDGELERQLRPGMNLTPDRYRFVRSLVTARSGSGSADERAEVVGELDRLYEGALRRRDDWNLGWTGWVAGQADARAGRSVAARRRLRTAIEAFGRAHRSGFADWPLATLVATAALHVGDPPDDDEVALLAMPRHAVRAERADALLALAQYERAHGGTVPSVAARLREAHDVAVRQREVVAGHLVSLEQLLLGVTPSPPPDDPDADGPVLAACREALSGAVDAIEHAGTELVRLGWSVLGARLLARAAERVRVDHPLRATRLLQTVRSVTDSFDEPLQPWALTVPPLPTLSAREMEVAEGIARGATREELAATLHVSRRTIDSHVQRVYAKLGITNRSELRSWLDDPARGVRSGRG